MEDAIEEMKRALQAIASRHQLHLAPFITWVDQGIHARVSLHTIPFDEVCRQTFMEQHRVRRLKLTALGMEWEDSICGEWVRFIGIDPAQPEAPFCLAGRSGAYYHATKEALPARLSSDP